MGQKFTLPRGELEARKERELRRNKLVCYVNKLSSPPSSAAKINIFALVPLPPSFQHVLRAAFWIRRGINVPVPAFFEANREPVSPFSLLPSRGNEIGKRQGFYTTTRLSYTISFLHTRTSIYSPSCAPFTSFHSPFEGQWDATRAVVSPLERHRWTREETVVSEEEIFKFILMRIDGK